MLLLESGAAAPGGALRAIDSSAIRAFAAAYGWRRLRGKPSLTW
jgi:hypothetical protein